MNEFGHILREARETKGLTLAQVQEQIRINAGYLEAMESGEYGRLPTPVHARGFLRNYARFLGLDPQPLLDRYQQTLAHPEALPHTGNGNDEIPLVLPNDQTFFDPVNLSLDDSVSRNRSESLLRLVIIIAILATIGLIANRFVPLLTGDGDGTEQLTEGINAVVQEITNSDATAVVPEATAVTPADGGIISTSRNDAASAAATPSPTRPSLPPLDIIRLKLEITERAWMEVTIDGDVVFSGIAKKGDPPYEWEAQQEAIVNTGNAVGVVVTINDILLGRLGGRGQNVEETWQTTN